MIKLRKILKVSLIVSLLGGVLGVSAYLSDSDSLKNRFSIQDSDIILSESDWDYEKGENALPNEIILKNPVISKVGSGDCYVAMKVSGLKEFISRGFIVGLVEDGILVNKDNEVFCWNPNFTLVNRDGVKVETANNNALTKDELISMEDEDVYFAYNEILSTDGSTEPLFSGVKYIGDSIESKVKVIKYFTKNNGNELYYPVTDGYCLDGEPSKNSDGEYIYKYKVSVDGVEEDIVYNTYKEAKLVSDTIRSKLESISLLVDAESIQTLDGEGEIWDSTEDWFPVLNEDF